MNQAPAKVLVRNLHRKVLEYDLNGTAVSEMVDGAIKSGRVRAPGYHGPDRRRRAHAFLKPKRRLADELARHADAEVFGCAETLTRRLRVMSDFSRKTTQERAELVLMLDAIARKGATFNEPSWVKLARAASAYLRQIGATGGIDDALVVRVVAAMSNAQITDDLEPVEPDIFAALEDA